MSKTIRMKNRFERSDVRDHTSTSLPLVPWLNKKMAKFDVRSTRLAVIPCLGMPIQDECTLLGLLIIYAVILFFFFFF